MNRTYLVALLMALGLSLSGCATVGKTSAEAAEPSIVEAIPPPIEAEDIEYGSFTEEQLYQAIVSELEAQRGRIEDAGQSYFELAVATRDLAILQRAVQFASANGDVNALLQLGLLWAELSPDDPQPRLMLSFQFLESGAYDQALSQMARVIDLGGSIDFSTLSARTGRLDDAARAGLITNLRQLSRELVDNESIYIALIQLLAQNRSFEDALLEMENLEQISAASPNTIQLKAQLQQAMDRGDQALRTLRVGVNDFSEDKQLRLTYARLLVQNEEFSAARSQFQNLVDQDPQDWETYYSMALLDLELELWDQAASVFKRLIDVDQRSNESQYYLGYLYEQKGELAPSIEHYRQVQVGTSNFLASQQQATRLAIQLGQLEEAHEWLSGLSRGQPRLEILFTTIESSLLIQEQQADAAKKLLDTSLNRYPNETDLLFARVLYFDSVTDRESSEADLRQIIKMKPDDSRALNHLGYMLADQTGRFEEALDLLEQAIAIAPDDPAIIDSLAWVQYKLGRYEDALSNLRRAFAVFPDHEVASHLGEVLWVMGQKEEASRIWQDALEIEPDSPIILETLERLQPNR